MNLKSCRYMESNDFKSRQGSFEYFRAKIFEYITETVKKVHAAYRKAYSLPKKINGQTQTFLFWEGKYHGRRTMESWNGYRLMSF